MTEGKNNTDSQSTIQSSIRESQAHVRQLHRGQRLLSEFMPLTDQTFTALADEQIEHIDQFVYRFSKLQDSLGLRFIPSLYTLLQNDNRPQPFMNILNYLEKLGILPSIDDWQFFRNLRNNLAHDYPETVAQTVTTLNLLYRRINDFIYIFDTLVESYNRYQDELGF